MYVQRLSLTGTGWCVSVVLDFTMRDPRLYSGGAFVPGSAQKRHLRAAYCVLWLVLISVLSLGTSAVFGRHDKFNSSAHIRN